MQSGNFQDAQADLDDASQLLSTIAHVVNSGKGNEFYEAHKSLDAAVKMLKSGDRDAARSEIDKARSALIGKFGAEKTGSVREKTRRLMGILENLNVCENFHQFFERFTSMADRSDRT